MNAHTTFPARWNQPGIYRLLTLMATALLLSVPLTAVSDELVVNGDFELPDLEAMGITDVDGNGWTTFFGQNVDPDYCNDNGFPECHDGTLVPGWEVYWSDTFVPGPPEPGRLEIQRGLIAGCLPCALNQKAELDTHHRPAPDGTFDPAKTDCNVTLMQRLNTCPRMPYTLSFSWHPRTQVSDDNNMLVMIGEDLLLKSTSIGTHWTDATYNFVTGDDFESLLTFEAFGIGNTLGMLLDDVSVQGRDGSNLIECEPIAVCGEKPANLELLYNGPYSDGDYYTQNLSEVVIDTFTADPLPQAVFIRVYDHRYGLKNQGLLFAEEVLLGETFSVLNPYGDWDKPFVPPRITIEIRDTGSNEILQRVTFHTSCSQPLNLADQFGGVAVFDFTPRHVNRSVR